MELIKYILSDGGRSIMAIIFLAVIFGGLRSCIAAFRSRNPDKDGSKE